MRLNIRFIYIHIYDWEILGDYIFTCQILQLANYSRTHTNLHIASVD